MLEGISRLLADQYEIVGTAGNGRELLRRSSDLKPDVVVLDIGMPDMNGIEAARQLAILVPTAKIVFVTQQLDADYVRAAFQAGGHGYASKQSASTELLTAIQMALEGKYYVTPLVLSSSPYEYRDLRKNPAELFASHLTPRQREVLQLIAEGKTMKEISAALNISVKTVEFHKSSLINELGLRTTAELTRYALQKRIVGG